MDWEKGASPLLTVAGRYARFRRSGCSRKNDGEVPQAFFPGYRVIDHGHDEHPGHGFGSLSAVW
jgi:hypothetical protein